MITAASYQKSEQIGVSQYRVQIQLTDDVTGLSLEWFTVSGATVADLRDDASRQIAARNALLTTKSALAGIAQGTAIPVVAPAPAATPAPTAAQVWADKARRLAKARAMGAVTGALATAITALQADVDGTYQAGFVDAM